MTMARRKQSSELRSRQGPALRSSERTAASTSRSRAYWKGYLRLSLVSMAVELYPAVVSSDKTALHQIHKPSGKRVRYEKVVPGLGPIETSDIVKGFEIEDNTFVVLEPEELDELRLESKRTIELVQFVDTSEIEPVYFDRPYYLVPEGDVSTEGFLVIRRALEQADKIGLGQMTMRGREYLVAVKPHGRGLLLETLRYADEIRPAAALFDNIADAQIDKDMVSLAAELIERKTKPFDPSAFHDSYRDALRELIERKRRGKAVVSTEEERARGSPAQVIDLMDALKKSVGGGPKPHSAGRRRGGRDTGKKRA